MIESPRLHIRSGQPSDIPAILSYYRQNQAYLAPFEPLQKPNFYTSDYWVEVLSERLLDAQADRALKLFLFLKTPPQSLIGSLNFANFSRGVFQNCTVGYSIAATYQGQGYMSEALRAGIDYVFSQLQMHRIEANYLPCNQRSGNLLKRLGFTVNGYAPDYLYIAGRWQDHILTSLINPKSDFGQ
ncbi:MAG: GNAT family N-acetyltransferase [Phormidesmis sp.]